MDKVGEEVNSLLKINIDKSVYSSHVWTRRFVIYENSQPT